MKQLLLIVWLCTFLITSYGQDLITRTLEGVSLQSTEQPNEISRGFDTHKSSEKIELFSWDNRKADHSLDQVNLKVHRSTLNKLKKNASVQLSIDIPVSRDKAFSLQLYPVVIRSENGRLLSQDGPQKSKSKTSFYRGIVKGDHGSIVSMAITENDMYIGIYDQNGVYRVSPSNFKSDNYSVWTDRAVDERKYSCGSSGEYKMGNTAHYPIEIDNTGKGNNRKALNDVVEVYVECDKELYDDKGGMSGTEDFVELLFAEVAALYANESINLMVSDIFVWSVNDPYRGNSNLGQILPQFGSNIQNNYNGRIASLLKGNTTNSCSISGLAWVDVLCNTYSSGQMSGPYNVNQGVGFCPLNENPTTLFEALDVSLLAHEIGHNVASPHTHGCCWGPNLNQAIDDCAGFNENCTTGGSQSCSNVSNQPASQIGTIMSYCNNGDVFTKGFGTEPGNLMRNRVAAATCLATGAPDCTENSLTYNNATIPDNTTEYSDSHITLNNSAIANNATVFWQAETEFLINGTFTIPTNSVIEFVREDCIN